jgi:glutaredoxin-like protein NrdH
MTLTIYTKNNCPFCDRAKTLLESRGIAYNTINLEQQPDAREFLVNQGLRSVPQIFNDSTLLQGGYQGLAAQPEEFWTNLKGKQ